MVKRRIECRHKCADIVFGFQVSCGSVGSLPSARPLALSSCVPLAILCCSNTLTFWDPDTHYFDALILLYYGTQIHYCYSNTLVFWVPDLNPDILNLCPNTLSNCLTHDITQSPTHGKTHNEEKKWQIKNSSIMCQIAQNLDPRYIENHPCDAKSSHIVVPLRV